MSLRPGELIIHDGNAHLYAGTTYVNGVRVMKGLVPRDLAREPVGGTGLGRTCGAVQMPLIPQSEWSARIKDKVKYGQQLSDIRLRGNKGQIIQSLDQNGQGFCWNYSVTATVMITRAVMGLPHVRLSGHANACIIKGFRDEGGWCGLSMDRQVTHGSPSVECWTEKSMSRSNDRPETWANAALHKVSDGWIDVDSPVYNRQLTFAQVATLLLCGVPVAGDFNWWGHSVCLLDLVEVEPGSFGVRILNSWTDGWGDRGMNVLQGSKAVPDSAVAPLATGASYSHAA